VQSQLSPLPLGGEGPGVRGFLSGTGTGIARRPSPVACVTVGQLPRILNLVFLHQLPPQGELVFGWLVIDPENVLAPPEVALRVFMAIKTPAHVKCVGSPSERHVSNRPMAGGASNALMDVNTVVKIGKVGKRVDARPRE